MRPEKSFFNDFLLPGETEGTAAEHDTMRQMVRENYFATMEIPLLQGRGFTAQDDEHAAKVALVSRSFARKFFPNEDVLGKRVTFNDDKREVEIIGVVADTKYESQREEIKPLFYTPWRQQRAEIGAMHFTLRTSGEPTALAATVRQVVRELDSNHRTRYANSTLAGYVGAGTLVRAALEFLRRSRAFARRHRTLWRVGLFGGPTHK